MKNGWISCAERMPGDYKSVIAFDGETGEMRELFRSDGLWLDQNANKYPMNVTHWQPLPEPPEES